MQSAFTHESEVVKEILTYAKRICARGWVCNTLGTIAARRLHGGSYAVYTKQRGVSLEEMDEGHVVATDPGGKLLHGSVPPSIGHQLNLAVFQHRSDVHAVIHMHVDEVIVLFSVMQWLEMPFISDDAALVLEKPVLGLERKINVEADASLVPSFIERTNCFVMHNHGITALGGSVSQAYHRLCTTVAEVRRLSLAMLHAKAQGIPLAMVPDDEIAALFVSGRQIIYGNT